VVGVNVSETASSSDKYARLRDELWFLGREWLAALDCKLSNDDALVGELTLPRYSIQSNGKLKVESKDEMKKRGVASPNRADAWLLTFARAFGAKRWSSQLRYRRLMTA
jgi:phage terminase large subunit